MSKKSNPTVATMGIDIGGEPPRTNSRIPHHWAADPIGFTTRYGIVDHDGGSENLSFWTI
jgi:hypothetical protein